MVMKKLSISCLVSILLVCFQPLLAGEGKEAVNRLVGSLKNGDGKAALALVKYGAAAVPGLVEGLKSGNPFVQGHAASALGQIGPPAKASIPDLVSALKSDVKTSIAAAIKSERRVSGCRAIARSLYHY